MSNSTHIIIPSFLLCIATILLQIAIMSLSTYYPVTLLLCSIAVLIICFILIYYNRDYTIIFTYTFILTVLSTIIFYMILLIRQNYILSETINNSPASEFLINILLKLPFDIDKLSLGLPLSFLIILNCITPFISGILVCLFDSYNKYRYFNKFFIQYSISAMLLYSVVLIYMIFIKEHIYTKETNLIPFMTIAAYIEDFILKNCTLSEAIKYFVRNIILFIPYGFYVGILIRESNKFIHLLTLTSLPLLFEIIKLIAVNKVFDIDYIILAVIGGIIGTVCFRILNSVFVIVKEEEFLNDNSSYIL